MKKTFERFIFNCSAFIAILILMAIIFGCVFGLQKLVENNHTTLAVICLIVLVLVVLFIGSIED